MSTPVLDAKVVLDRSDELRRELGEDFRDRVVTSLYSNAQQIADRTVQVGGGRTWDLDQKIDRVVTSRVLGLPLMLFLLAAVFWVTIVGANVPSELLATGFFSFEGKAAAWFSSLGAPWWLTGFIWHGVFRGLAWVVSVMLPPMMIFFPLFTILEDLGLFASGGF